MHKGMVIAFEVVFDSCFVNVFCDALQFLPSNGCSAVLSITSRIVFTSFSLHLLPYRLDAVLCPYCLCICEHHHCLKHQVEEEHLGVQMWFVALTEVRR